jgi:hypothetical protein
VTYVAYRSTTDIQKAESSVMTVLRAADHPLAPREVQQRGQAQGCDLPDDLLRQVLWTLVSQGKIRFTADWYVQLARD